MDKNTEDQYRREIDRLQKESTFAWSFTALMSLILLISSIINILINS